MRGEFPVGAFVDREQQPLEIGDEALVLELPPAPAVPFPPCRAAAACSAERSIGGIAMVVRIAMVTIMENRFWLSTPIDRPMVAMMTSVDPRAFMPQASARDSLPAQPADAAADEGAAELSEAGDQHQRAGQQQQFGSFRIGQIGAQDRQGRRTPA